MPGNQRVQDAIRARLEREPAVSKRALAEEMGVTPTQLGEYLSGRRRPQSAKLLRMSGPLGVSPGDLDDSSPHIAVDDANVVDVLRDLSVAARAMHDAISGVGVPDLLSALRRAERLLE